MTKPTKLELTRIGKDTEYNLEPRILIESPDLSHDPDGSSENMLIHGDNLLALKALEQDYAGQIKCIYIDPPYNTGNAFEHYDDGLEHSQWLSLMKPRLELLRSLLSDDGVIFISIDDDEYHYLKILCDEIFGRKNYSGSFIWEKKKKPSFLNSQMGSITEYILAYGKNKKNTPAFTYGTTSGEETYPLYNAGNTRGILTFPSGSMKFTGLKDGEYLPDEYVEKTSVVKLLTTMIIENGYNKNEISLEGEWRYGQKAIDEQILNGEYYIVKSAKFRPRRVFNSGDKSKKCHNLLSRAHYNIASYEDSAKEGQDLFGSGKFDYPKPEMLINFLIGTITQPGDLVLDSFLGSGTTAAVAHKMGRRWIGIELGDHAYTHAKVRMDKVIEGEQGGISKAVDWKGGGSYKFYELGPSLLLQDQFGQWIINKELDGDKLIQALCKIENYHYMYDDQGIKHGRSSETSFLHVTTRHINQAIIDDIATTHLGANEGLLILARTYDIGIVLPANIRLKKIPKSIINKCEYGKSDYNLPVTAQDVDDEYDDEA